MVQRGMVHELFAHEIAVLQLLRTARLHTPEHVACCALRARNRSEVATFKSEFSHHTHENNTSYYKQLILLPPGRKVPSRAHHMVSIAAELERPAHVAARDEARPNFAVRLSSSYDSDEKHDDVRVQDKFRCTRARGFDAD